MSIQEWKNKGYIKYVKWHTVNDSEVCSLCKERAEKEFLLSKIENIFPAHKGCRCWLTPIVDTELLKNQTEDFWKDVKFED